MKKFLVVLMSLGLIMAIAMPAAAVDVKFSGLWYMAGTYVDNPSLLDKQEANTNPSWGNTSRRGAEAFYQTALSVNTTFQVVEGLALKTAFSTLNGMMGDNSWAGGGLFRSSQGTSSRMSTGVSGSMTRENIEIQAAWADVKLPFGRLQAGYAAAGGGGWGTMFGNDIYTWPTIRYDNTFGPVSIFTSVMKIREWSNANAFGRGYLAANSGLRNDSDSDAYRIGAVVKFKPGEAGLMYEFWRDARAKAIGIDGSGIVPPGSNGWVTKISTVAPYAKFQFGPAYIEAEGWYRFGQLRQYETFTTGFTPQSDVDVSAWAGYIKGEVNFKPFFAGAMFVYKSGDEMKDQNKVTGSIAQGFGDDYLSPGWNLIMFNYDLIDPVGSLQGNIGPSAATGGQNPRTIQSYQMARYMDNIWYYQVYAGVNPTAKLNITAKLAYATADKKPKSGVGAVGETLTTTNAAATTIQGSTKIREFVSDKFGTEVDLIATYKIYDNLTYSVGAGYFWTGDYFKGYDSNAVVKDNYILTHKLRLAF